MSDNEVSIKTGFFKNVRRKLWNFYRSFFIGYIPDNLYTTDFRLLFILTAIYTSLVSEFRQSANQESDEDVASGKLLRINSFWTNHSVSGGVSDRVLWNCRSDSPTVIYYKTLYFGLITFYCVVVIVYLVASMIINGMVAFAVSKLKIDTSDGKRKSYLEIVANTAKITCHHHKNLKDLKQQWESTENRQEVEDKLFNIDHKKWFKNLLGFKQNAHFYNWLTVLYIIPRIETMIMISVLTLALTSYDIHPIGCLSPIGVSYNETEASVNLILSENVIRYQKASIILIFLLGVLWFMLKLFQYSLLPRYKWGLQIKKSDNSSCCRQWTIIRQHRDS